MDTLPELEKEVSRWKGVSATCETKGRKGHPRLWLEVGDQRRFVVYSSTSVERRAVCNCVSHLRRTLREMGAEKERA